MGFVVADHYEKNRSRKRIIGSRNWEIHDEDEDINRSRKRKIVSRNLEIPSSMSDDPISRVTRELENYLSSQFPICKLIVCQKFDPLTKNIPNDLIIEIFARLPVKPLLKFRCLSRYYDSLISSKQFVKTHLQTNTNYDVLSVSRFEFRGTRILKHYYLHSLFLKQTSYAADILYCPPIIHPGTKVAIVDTVNGLCCLLYGDSHSHHIVLWNPSTTKFYQLSNMDSMDIRTIGFGLVNGSDDDYKVFCVYDRQPVRGQPAEVVAAIFSLKTGSWRLIPNSEYCNCFSLRGKAMFVCGKIHWLAQHGILSFNLGTEAEELVPQPSNIRQGRFTRSLSKLGGSLCLFLNYHESSKDLWVMKDYGIKESWVKVVTISEIQIPWNICPTFLTTFTPLYVSEDGVFLFASSSTFVIYNPKDGTFRYPRSTNFPLLEGFDFGPGGLDNKVNIQSLVSPFPDVRT